MSTWIQPFLKLSGLGFSVTCTNKLPPPFFFLSQRELVLVILKRLSRLMPRVPRCVFSFVHSSCQSRKDSSPEGAQPQDHRAPISSILGYLLRARAHSGVLTQTPSCLRPRRTLDLLKRPGKQGARWWQEGRGAPLTVTWVFFPIANGDTCWPMRTAQESQR